MEEVTIEDKIYVSAKRAAEITGYARDYVGQLCREGHIDAKMVGRSWYVYEPSIRAHRFGEGSVEAQKPAVQEERLQQDEVHTKRGSVLAPDPKAEETPNEVVGTWQKPIYTVEEPEMLPPIVPMPDVSSLTDMQSAWQEWFVTRQTALQSGVSDAPELETAEIIDARAEDYAREREDEDDDDNSDQQETEDTQLADTSESSTEEYEEDAEEDEEIAVPLHKIADVREVDEEPVLIRRVRPNPVQRVEPVRLVPPAEVQRVPRYIPVASAPQEAQGRVVHERIVRRSDARSKKTSHAPVTALLVGICLIAIAVAAIGSGVATKYLHTTAGTNPIIDFLVGTRQFSR